MVWVALWATPLNIIFQYKLFNKCYYELHSRIYIYSCLELIEFIFSISQFKEMTVGTFCILLVLNELFTVSSMCQVIKNSMTVLKLYFSFWCGFPFPRRLPRHGATGSSISWWICQQGDQGTARRAGGAASMLYWSPARTLGPARPS